ncbi:oligosaccharide flippase family protein [Steroidobacter sp. S1-65]|uniref:Oligosaccharide flippase family protein n=1 Tax=Steroidobacter gossypii TaxID=2805490 RepID=A0ABS1X555_9GAMM|nr:oligosaccharide flippase family protein [Steroidobacter gossypii]MBM0108352.1 oligosaccharide flippase family protein [Steroidobacter gossypii]
MNSTASEPSLGRRTGRNAIALLACRVGADLLNFLLFLAVSRTFGPEGTGEYGYGFALAGLVYYAATLGIDEYGVREYGRLPSERRPALIANLLGAQVCIALLVIVVLLGYLWITKPSPQLLAIIVSMTIYQLGAAFSATLFVPAMAEQRMLPPAVINLLGRGSAFVITGVLILVFHWSLYAASAAFAGGGLLMFVLALRSAASFKAHLRPNLTRQVVFDGARTLWSFAATGLLGQLLNRIGVIALSLQVGEAAAGIYTTGLKLVEVACLPLVFIGVAAYPRLCQAFADPAGFQRLTRQALMIGFGLALVLAVAMYLAVPPLLVPVLGERFAGAEAIIAAMAAIVLAQGIEIVLGRLMLSANLNVARAIRIALGTVVCVLLTVGLTPLFGIEATIAALVCSYLLVDLLYFGNLFGALRRTSRTPEPV